MAATCATAARPPLLRRGAFIWTPAKCATVRASPSFSGTIGCQPSNFRGAQRARDDNRPALSAPFRLAQQTRAEPGTDGVTLRLPVYVPELGAHLDTPDHPLSVLRGLAEFREHLGGRLTVLLLRGIGRAFEANAIDAKSMIRSSEVLRQVSEGNHGFSLRRYRAAASPVGCRA